MLFLAWLAPVFTQQFLSLPPLFLLWPPCLLNPSWLFFTVNFIISLFFNSQHSLPFFLSVSLAPSFCVFSAASDLQPLDIPLLALPLWAVCLPQRVLLTGAERGHAWVRDITSLYFCLSFPYSPFNSISCLYIFLFLLVFCCLFSFSPSTFSLLSSWSVIIGLPNNSRSSLWVWHVFGRKMEFMISISPILCIYETYWNASLSCQQRNNIGRKA